MKKTQIHKIKYFTCLSLTLLTSCQSDVKEAEKSEVKPQEKNATSSSTKHVESIDNKPVAILVDSTLSEKEKDTTAVISSQKGLSRAWNTLVDIQTINSNIKVDLKYATSDNFMKMVLYDTISRVYLQKDVAIRLGKCQKYLSSLNKGYHLLVYDGVRPVSVQWKMWRGLDTIPVRQRVKFVSNPANGSIHNYGAAVDLTICDRNGKPLDMGAGYDDIRKIAYPKLESHYLGTGELTKEQISNRKMLRKVMTSQNFRNISTEWWHFNACSRNTAKAKYVQLK